MLNLKLLVAPPHRSPSPNLLHLAGQGRRSKALAQDSDEAPSASDDADQGSEGESDSDEDARPAYAAKQRVPAERPRPESSVRPVSKLHSVAAVLVDGIDCTLGQASTKSLKSLTRSAQASRTSSNITSIGCSGAHAQCFMVRRVVVRSCQGDAGKRGSRAGACACLQPSRTQTLLHLAALRRLHAAACGTCHWAAVHPLLLLLARLASSPGAPAHLSVYLSSTCMPPVPAVICERACAGMQATCALAGWTAHRRSALCHEGVAGAEVAAAAEAGAAARMVLAETDRVVAGVVAGLVAAEGAVGVEVEAGDECGWVMGRQRRTCALLWANWMASRACMACTASLYALQLQT